MQGDRAATVRDRLNRVGAALYSAWPHVEEAITELEEILALEPGSADAHMRLGIACFGWGDATTLQQIELRWPSAARQILKDVRVNQILVVKEPAQP